MMVDDLGGVQKGPFCDDAICEQPLRWMSAMNWWDEWIRKMNKMNEWYESMRWMNEIYKWDECMRWVLLMDEIR